MTNEADVEPGEHRAPIRKALSLSMLNTTIARVGTFVTGVVLARLLSPGEFGIYAVALVVLTALLAINELGVSLAIVRWKGDPREIAPTVTTISLAASVMLFAICWFLAPLITRGLSAPDATGVVRLLSASVLIDGLIATPAQLLNREFRQGRRLLVDLASLTITTGVTIWLAATGHGPWSLAIGLLVGNGLSALVLFQLAGSWPRPGFDRRQAAALLRFGLPLAGSSLLVFAMQNLDYVVTGAMLGVVALGFYVLAFNLAAWPVNVFSEVMRRVSFPAFARVQDDPARRQETLIRLAALLAATTLPVCVLLALLAEPLVITVYGTKWLAASTVLSCLAGLSLGRVAAELAYDFLVALGRSHTTMCLQGLWLLALGVALPLGAHLDGIRGVAIGHAIVALGLMIPAYGIAVRRTGINLRALLAELVRPVIGCLLMVGAVLAVRAFTDTAVLQLVLGAAFGLTVYIPVVWPLRHVLGTLDQTVPVQRISPNEASPALAA